MRSGGPWNLRGLRPEAREAARIAAQRSGISVGEWLNDVIEPEEDAEPDDGGTATQRPRVADDKVDLAPAARAPWRNSDRQGNHDRQGNRDHQDRRDRRPQSHGKAQSKGRGNDLERNWPRHNAHIQEADRESARARDAIREARRIRDEAREAARQEGRRQAQRTREELGALHGQLEKLSRQLERVARLSSEAVARRPEPSPLPPRREPIPASGEDSAPAKPPLTGAPQRPRPPSSGGVPNQRPKPATIDQAVAEIMARQRALDADELSTPTAPAVSDAPQAGTDLGRAAPQPAAVEMATLLAAANVATSPETSGADDRLIGPPLVEVAPPLQAAEPEKAPEPPVKFAAEPTIDLGNLEEQLRHITTRIEALRPSKELENAVGAIRTDLAEMARSITEALPRRAVDALEIEIKALGQRIEHSRQCGADATALGGVERGLAEVRDALRSLTPAENLVGYQDAVKELTQRLDGIATKDDAAALQQIETAIGTLRGIVAHVASDEALAKVAEDVRALAEKVDRLADTAASGRELSALENRIDTLASALTASAEAGHAVPRELEKLLTGLIEKLEWVQLTHTDHAAMAHLEDRIATLVQRLDASDARFGHLEAVERGVADLLVQTDQIRGLVGTTERRRTPPVAGIIERDIAAIKQSETAATASPAAVKGPVADEGGRSPVIESGERETALRDAPSTSPTVATTAFAPPTPPMPPTAELESPALPPSPPPAATPPGSASAKSTDAAARSPIDPNLPPDHPLEPGSAVSRARPALSAADRIAASEAVVSSTTKPPVIADPGERANFIAAARRAAQAAAAEPPSRRDRGLAEAPTLSGEKPKPRARTLIVAGAAALIVIGCLQIASRFFLGGGSAPPPAAQSEKTAPADAPPLDPNPSAAPAAPSQQSAPPAVLPGPPASTEPPAPPDQKSGALTVFDPTQQLAARNGPTPLDPPSQPQGGTDITGALPQPATATNAATVPASAPSGDKLPAGIGGPVLRAAALSGDAAAAYEIGTRFLEGRGTAPNNQEAALWLDRAAKQGLAPAQFRLGGLYEKGAGVKKDFSRARDLYLAAANKGNGKAMHNLAVLYAEGIDGPPDYNNAARWFREAADHGVTDSQYNLGILYARGIGVAQNLAESFKWFALAANQGDPDAGKKRDEIGAKLDPQSLAAARLAAKTWTAVPQPDDAINVKPPAGGWDGAAGAASTPRPKPRLSVAKSSALARTSASAPAKTAASAAGVTAAPTEQTAPSADGTD